MIRPGIVAENSTVWRVGGVEDRIRSMSSMKPMSSISSASSSTATSTESRDSALRSIRSIARPGVATTMSTPRRSEPSCGPIGAPP